MQVPLIQYQVKTEPITGWLAPIAGFESSFHQPWSEPVRFPISKGLKIALITSGLIAPVLDPARQTFPGFAAWTRPLEVPVRVKPRLITGAQQFTSTHFNQLPPTALIIQGWYQNLREPVWPKKGLRSHLQSTHTEPVRYLPPANVTATISATEVNADVMEMDIFVYDEITPTPEAIASANVTISEIAVNTEANVSFREREPD